MTKFYFRVVVAMPLVAVLLTMWIAFSGVRPDWPEPALQYVAWYQNSLPTPFEYWIARLGMLGLVGLLISSLGVILLWSPARFLYVVSVVVAVVAEIPGTPVLIGMPEILLDNVAKIFLGVTIALIFTHPCAEWFTKSRAAD